MGGKPTFLAVGTRKGNLVVTEVFHNGSSWHVKVKCDCGNEKVVSKSNFNSGRTTTCGCGPRGRPIERIHGLAGTPAYNSWKKMMQRCYNPAHQDYKNYGGRGIKVCDRWQDVRNFVADMGQRPLGLSIERENVDKDYTPDNCVWLPMGEQAKNRRPWTHTEEGLKSIAEARRASKKEVT